MSIEAVSAVAANAAPAGASGALAATGVASAGPVANSPAFDAILDSITQVNREMQATQQAVESMALGKSDNLHQVMMSLEQTRLSFELLLQVRNRVLEAYQELMRMQV